MIDKNLNSKKALGHDIISDKVIKELPKKGIALMTSIFNVTIHVWLLSILMETVNHHIHSRTKIVSYHPFSLLSNLSRLFEKQLSKRLRTILDDTMTTPNRQFGFRKRHSTTEQVYRITHNISRELEKKKYYSEVFFDIKQAFWITT